MRYIFTNVIGTFVFDQNMNKIDSVLNTTKEVADRDAIEKQLIEKHGELTSVPQEMWAQLLENFKDEKYFSIFVKEDTKLTRQNIKLSISEDLLVTQTIANFSELDKIINTLTKRLREWYGLYLPEFEHIDMNQEKFVELVFDKNKKKLLQEFKIDEKSSMGADLDEIHVQEMKFLAKRIISLIELRTEHEKYLQTVMKKYCPNLLELGGVTISAKLLELSKGLKRLALLPASTIQLLGAEKALFRHIKTGSRSPKHGIIIQHPIVQNARRNLRGKMARRLADKLSLCARLDYFKGEFKAPEYKEELEKELEKQKALRKLKASKNN